MKSQVHKAVKLEVLAVRSIATYRRSKKSNFSCHKMFTLDFHKQNDPVATLNNMRAPHAPVLNARGQQDRVIAVYHLGGKQSNRCSGCRTCE